jgi:hypothetical protein
MGIPITAGRDFAPPELLRDTAGIIIGSDLAQLWFGKESALGRRIVRDESNMRRDYHPAGPSERVIIGVIDERAAGPAMTPEGARVYVPVNHRVPTGSSVRLRTFGPAQAMVPTIRKVALAEAPNTPINSITTLSAERAAEARGLMLVSGAAGAGGLLALFLSAIGLYALVSLGVTQRRREIGIRTALGADRGDVINLFFAGGLKLSLLGLLLGLPLSLFALRTLQRYNDDAQISIISLAALVVLCVIVVASLAAWIPARRAALVNPLDTLRDAG